MPMMLTQQERHKFSLWLRENAESNSQISEQMKSVGGPMIEALAVKYRNETTACLIVAALLDKIQDETIR